MVGLSLLLEVNGRRVSAQGVFEVSQQFVNVVNETQPFGRREGVHAVGDVGEERVDSSVLSSRSGHCIGFGSRGQGGGFEASQRGVVTMLVLMLLYHKRCDVGVHLGD